MAFSKFGSLLFLLFFSCDLSFCWLQDRPILESIAGNLFITGAKDRNITLKPQGIGKINIDGVDVLHALWEAKNASQLVSRWKNGLLDDVEVTLQRLSHIVEGPNGLVRKLSAIESGNFEHPNSSAVRPSGEVEPSQTSSRLRSITTRLRRLENKVRSITSKLRKDECASDPCLNGGTCIDLYDSFHCQCPAEWEGSVCTVDVNECERLAGKPTGCQNGATCTNLPGSFSCACPPGWHGFHCSTKKSACEHGNEVELCGHGICVSNSSPLGYSCVCAPGWERLSESDPACRKDVDECATGRYPCSLAPLVTCHNVPGTFYCGTCPAGYTGDGYKCQDLDECLIGNGGCSTNPTVECINTPGSRQCGPCPSGYQGDGVTCFYVGSCTVDNGGCHSLATCREGAGSVVSCLCPAGYRGSGRGPRGCQPAREDTSCGPCVHGTCAENPTGPVCVCLRGYTGDSCNEVVNQCRPNPCQNGGTCRTSLRGRPICDCPASFSGPTCATAKQACGGFFASPQGYVEFPVGRGNKYDHSLSCAWVLLTNQSMVLNVTFTRFALESSHGGDECKHDYVQIHDGRSAGSHIFGRYCGRKLPNNGTILSTHNSLYVWFHSDSSISSDGFAFNWTSVKPQCGGVLNEEYGSISSPGFPGKYPANRDCYWNINVAPGKRIALHFISMMFEEHPTCQYDYLEVNETSYMGQHQLGVFCNHSKPAPITTAGSHVLVHFHSDTSGSDGGFHLSFLSVAGAPDCGGVYTGESGEITSPGYHSGSYKPDLICEWEIRLPAEATRVQLKWLNFELERSRQCMFDSVQVYEGPDTSSPLVGKFCGTTPPPILTIKSNRILIRFESDVNLEERGFVLKYEVECGGIFSDPTGIITSPFYPNSYPASKDCIYLIEQPVGKGIVLTFEAFDIEEGTEIENKTECYFDRLDIRDGDTENSTLLASVCGSMRDLQQNPMYSTHNYMFLEFFTDANVHNRGFRANYTTIDRGCGGILRNAPGTISMPGPQPTKWQYTIDCLWTVRAPPKHAIQLTWTSYPSRQTSMSEECGKNYLELVEDYGSDDAKSLGKYCPIKTPPQIMTTQGNDLTLHYHFTKEASQDSTWQVNYAFINDSHTCGGHYYSEAGQIRSPNYPNRYPRNKECIWIIETKVKYQITIEFQSFELENSTTCAYDYLEVRSGTEKNAPLLGKFCGSQVQDELTSMTNQIAIKFVSDNSLQKRGFEMRWYTTKAGCGGSLRTSSGSIMSPNYPQNYYHRITCTWTIRVAAGSIVRLTFADFDLEDHARCAFDYLELSDMVAAYSQNSRRFCGSSVPSVVLSQSNLVKLVFRSDLLTSSRGFHLRYATECNNNVTGFQGVIESPNFPENYDNLNNCTWIISAPAGNRINLTFSHFDVRTSRDCKQDYIRIREGDNNEPNTELLAAKCGSEEEVLPLKLTSSQRQMFVSFSSDRIGTARGFRLEWFVDGCSKHLSKPTGRFTSPGYPNGDKIPQSFVECQWLIEVAFDKSIEITFPKIENTRTRACLSDNSGSLEIYNGRNEQAPVVAHNLCYSDVPVTFTSTGNHMFIKYAIETSYSSHGFAASYKSVDIKCGGKFTGQSGVIHSANYPNNYPHNQYCEWLITVDPYHAVNLTFIELDLERSRNCTDDYIKVYDGDSQEAPLLGTHCQQNDLRPNYTSTSNQLLVIMRTDQFVSAKGFKALYNRTCGARIIVDGQGILRSSATLHTSEAVNCSWILAAKDPGDKVTLTFSHVDLLESLDCWANHIEVYEGEGTSGPLLANICTNKIPQPFTSSGSALTVHMTSVYGQSVGDRFDAVYSSLSTACGGLYTAETGILASPNYPLSYPTRADCTWTIRNSPGNRVSLVFPDFELLDSPNCDSDYVEVRERDGMGKLLGLFCGSSTDSVTSNQSLWIRFRSAESSVGTGRGFKAEYSLLFGDELTGDSGELASPLYPRPYRKGDSHSWRITVEFNYVVSLQFLDLHFDNYQEYCYSSLKIYDGYNDEAPQLKELCGISKPSEPIISTGNIVFIEMENSFDAVGNWFHLKWIKVPRLGDAVSQATQDIKSSESSELIYLTESNASFIFHSPGYPDGYEDNLKYSWTFISPVGTHLLLRFLSMNIEESEDCVTDYVAVYNGQVTAAETPSNDKLLKKACLSNSTLTNISGTNVMTVNFVTDSYKNKTGFSAIVLTECGGIIEQSSGYIQVNTSVQSSKPRPYTYSCEWIVKVGTGKRIGVKVVENQIESNQQKTTDDNSCRSNYLMLKNGGTPNSPLLGTGKWCNSVKPSVQNTSSNYLYVKLAVSFATVNFKLLFRELGSDCGGRFELSSKTESQAEITSPNYPNIPTPHTECFWTFMSVDEHRLSIHFLDRFDLAYSEDCEKEYVEIRDGGTDSSPLLGRFCKNTPPSTISTKGNFLYVHYFTNQAEPRNGFKALVTTGEVCGGIQRESRGGVITSPNYPEPYDLKSNLCSWWIVAPASAHGIKLQFQNLELPVRMNCSATDHVTIYEKLPGSSNNTEVGTYCGRKSPGVIDILTNEAMIIFQSSFTNTRLPFHRGFRLNYTFSQDGCGGSLSGLAGDFQTAGYPRTTSYKYCVWKISVPIGMQVAVDIIDLDLSGNQFSLGSHVTFYHDPDNVATIALLRESTSTRVLSSSNFMSVYYISTGGHRGMKAKFTALAPAPCGGQLDAWEGVLTSPRSSPFNESTFYCKWLLQQPTTDEPPVGLTLSMQISGLINRGRASISCRNYLSYVSIKGDELVAKICGNWTQDPLAVASPFKTHTIEAINATHSERVNFTLNYKWHKCGGILVNVDEIQAPANLTLPVHCVWKVKFPEPDESILVKFNKMNLGSCDKNFLQIKGRNFRSPVLGKFCGNEIPQSLISQTNEITVEYYATERSADFKINIERGKYTCGGILKGRKNELRSPGFPQAYPNNTECVWEINANNGYHVGLKFVERFNLETSTNCTNDYVEVYEWKPEVQVSNTSDIGWQSLGRVCGRTAPAEPFNATTNKMKVKFVSNDKVEGEGFRAMWYSNCGGVYAASETPQYIESPKFPSYYASNTFCNYTILAPDDQEIVVDFSHFVLEGNSATCPYDNLTINFFSGDWLRGKDTWCGTNSPGRRVGKDRMEVIFRTDNSVNRAGFKFKYSLNDCGGLITTPRMVSPTMDNDPDSYEYTHCNWIVKAPAHKSVLLRFETLNITQSYGNCISSFVRVFEGNSTSTSQQKATFCGDMHEHLPVLQSTGDMMTVVYHASSYGGHGHALKFAVLFVNGPEQGCGGSVNLSDSGFTPFRTQKAEEYEPLQDCHWLVTAPQGYTVQFYADEADLKITAFNGTSPTVGDGTDCRSDYVEIRDGGPYAELLSRFCGTQKPPIIVSTTNLLWIRFVSDGVGQGRGVRGTLKAVLSRCGLTELVVSNSTQVLTSPNYPGGHASAVTCRWKIHGGPERFRRVHIRFLNFNLDDSESCENDYLTLADMDNREVVSEGFGNQLIIGGTRGRHHSTVVASRVPRASYKYCGTELPHDYYSNYKDVEITYKSSPGQSKGFKLEFSKATCSHNYTEAQGRILHDDITDCWMTIEVEQNNTINVYFNAFFLPGGTDCSDSYMEIREGGFDGPVIQSVCNYETPNPVFSTGKRLSIHAFKKKEINFHSSHYDLTYTSTDKGQGCGGRLYNYGGVFTSPLYPSPYRRRSSCIWDVSVPRGLKVSLQFTIFDIASRSMCETDYLTISEILPNGDEETIVTYCGGDVPAEYHGRSNRVLVTYATSVNNGGSGWVAHFASTK